MLSIATLSVAIKHVGVIMPNVVAPSLLAKSGAFPPSKGINVIKLFFRQRNLRKNCVTKVNVLRIYASDIVNYSLCNNIS
jgi:hypothetical protein